MALYDLNEAAAREAIEFGNGGIGLPDDVRAEMDAAFGYDRDPTDAELDEQYESYLRQQAAERELAEVAAVRAGFAALRAEVARYDERFDEKGRVRAEAL
jgi:hypothetical protein